MSKDDPWAYWRAALEYSANPDAKPKPDFDKAHPETGFYRMKQKAVAIWRGSDGTFYCAVNGEWANMSEERVSESIFAYCCRNPISAAAYKKFMATKRWPEDIEPPSNGFVLPESSPDLNNGGTKGESGTPIIGKIRQEPPPPGMGDNLPKALDKAIAAELDDLVERALAWFEGKGKKIESQEAADTLANYSKAVEGLEKRAVAAHAAEKRPYASTIAVIDDKWDGLLKRAAEAKKNLKTLLTPWLVAQRDKAQAEARAAEALQRKEAAERTAAIQAGMTPPPPTFVGAKVSKTVAGTQGRVSLRGHTVYEVSDLKKASAYFASLDKPPPDFVEAVRKAGAALARAGFEVPGIVSRTEDSVA